MLNQLKCEKCGGRALGVVNKVWLCGPCIAEYDKKLNERLRKFILEE